MVKFLKRFKFTLWKGIYRVEERKKILRRSWWVKNAESEKRKNLIR